MAPQEYGLLGSTARIPTCRFRRARAGSVINQRALAGTRRYICDADRQRPPGEREQKPAEFVAYGVLVLNDAGRSCQGTKITRADFFREFCGEMISGERQRTVVSSDARRYRPLADPR